MGFIQPLQLGFSTWMVQLGFIQHYSRINITLTLERLEIIITVPDFM